MDENDNDTTEKPKSWKACLCGLVGTVVVMFPFPPVGSDVPEQKKIPASELAEMKRFKALESRLLLFAETIRQRGNTAQPRSSDGAELRVRIVGQPYSHRGRREDERIGIFNLSKVCMFSFKSN